MVMLAAAQSETRDGLPIEVVEYTALTAKLVLAGHGRADKKLMMESVRKILGLAELHSKIDDAADALAMALTHHYKVNGLAAAPIEIEKKVSAASKSRAKVVETRKKKEDSSKVEI
jgi:crossover junction endodeoxyribonuclease RuvC